MKRRLALAALGVSVAGATAVWVLSERLVVVDPRPARCEAGPERKLERFPAQLGRLGHYDVALSKDGCLRGTFSLLGARRAFRLYEVQPDGSERLYAVARLRWLSQGWDVPQVPQRLRPVPKYLWGGDATDITDFTWYGYRDAAPEPVERVERQIRGRGHEYREERFAREGDHWVSQGPQTYVLDLAPDGPRHFAPGNEQF